MHQVRLPFHSNWISDHVNFVMKYCKKSLFPPFWSDLSHSLPFCFYLFIWYESRRLINYCSIFYLLLGQVALWTEWRYCGWRPVVSQTRGARRPTSFHTPWRWSAVGSCCNFIRWKPVWYSCRWSRWDQYFLSRHPVSSSAANTVSNCCRTISVCKPIGAQICSSVPNKSLFITAREQRCSFSGILDDVMSMGA